MAGIGFCGVALELILIYVFQGLYGYVYSRVGLMVGIFMLGSIVGAGLARRWEAFSPGTVQRGMVLANAALLAVALALPRLVAALASGPRCGPGMIYLMLVVVGAVVGAQFVGANSVFRSMGLSRARAASTTGVADYWGSALGGMLMGVLFVPIWGVGTTCVIVASVLGAGLLCLTTVCDRCS
jgi:spermidine synthase